MNDLFVGIWCLVSGIIMIWVGVDHIRKEKKMKDIDKVKRGLECCQADEYGNCEHCKECPYNEVSVFVDECRTQLSKDALEVIRNG